MKILCEHWMAGEVRTISSASSSSISTLLNAVLRCSVPQSQSVRQLPQQPTHETSSSARQQLTYTLARRVPLYFIAYARDDLLEVLFIVIEQRGGRSIHDLVSLFLSLFLPKNTTVNVRKRGA